MDNHTLHAQCANIAICINGLSLTLKEADGGGAVSKIVSDVHKLIKSFRLLGKYYVSELLKKCRELETKNQELENLSRKLEQVQRESTVGHSIIPWPDFDSDVSLQQRREKSDKFFVQCLKTNSEPVERPREGSTFLEGVPDESRTKTAKEKEQMENLAAENGSLLKHHAAENGSLARVLLKDPKDFQGCCWLESTLKESMHVTSAKRSSPHSEGDHDLPLLGCARVDKGIVPCPENIFHTSIQSIQKLDLVLGNFQYLPRTP